MKNFNVLSRRSFLDRSTKAGLAAALATLTDIPFVMKRALAEGSIGLNGKKVLFIWLRFGNDGLNNIIPIQDPEYAAIRSTIEITKDALDYSVTGPADFPVSSAVGTDTNFATHWYNKGIRLGNGFAALHPALKFLAPVYNAGDLALIHRVAYPKQSRSHFDSQNYWENGNPNNNLSKDGIFYRTIIESGLANTAPLTGISIQSALPLILRGSAAAMTNLTSPTRYDLLGVPTPANDTKAFNAMAAGNYYPFAAKRNRDLLELQYQNMSNTLRIFGGIDFSEAGNIFRDTANTDGDTAPYYLFPTTNAKNGGYAFHSNNAAKYVVPTGQYNFFGNLKAAAMILNKTDAIIAGTELSGFDTHQTQGGATGGHASLLQTVGWAMYAVQKYFTQYAEKVGWNDVVVVTLSEFGRTSVENSNSGTDHAEAGVMYCAGGAIKGFGQGNPSGVFGCSPTEFTSGDARNWVTGTRTGLLSTCNTMYAAGVPFSGNALPVAAGYLRRSNDYRSILGEIIRKHLGSTQNQLNKIIPGYATAGEHLLDGGTSSVDGVPIRGELGIL
ncbi:MAG: DUF1501 domain-containing protein [Pedosphaera sp.]|nr:DUF1501 domain-containing protein [Pedosphaera sp.]